jgi:hypothetical protein
MQGDAEAGKRGMQGWHVRNVSSCAAGQKPWRKKNEGSAVSAGRRGQRMRTRRWNAENLGGPVWTDSDLMEWQLTQGATPKSFSY